MFIFISKASCSPSSLPISLEIFYNSLSGQTLLPTDPSSVHIFWPPFGFTLIGFVREKSLFPPKEKINKNQNKMKPLCIAENLLIEMLTRTLYLMFGLRKALKIRGPLQLSHLEVS